jgi:hypothetical protein
VSAVPRGKGNLPGFFALAWGLFMQPVLLHGQLRACGIDRPGDSTWWLWRSPQEGQAIRRTYVLRMLTLLVALSFFGGLAAIGLAKAVDYPLDSQYVALSVAAGVTFGVAFGVAYGVARRGPCTWSWAWPMA